MVASSRAHTERVREDEDDVRKTVVSLNLDFAENKLLSLMLSER